MRIAIPHVVACQPKESEPIGAAAIRDCRRPTPAPARPPRRGTAVTAIGFLAVHAWLVTAAAQAPPARVSGSLQGRVDIRQPAGPAERRPGIAELGTAAPLELAGTPRAVVYLETAPRGAFEDRRQERQRIDQRNETFVPHVLAVTAGTLVDFPNNDSIYHNVFSLSKTKRFDLGRYARGRSKSVRFDRPGIVRVFCDIHSHMSAFVLVFSHPYFATTDGNGRYRIDGIPPGTYTAIAWAEGADGMSRTITVPAQGGVVEQDFEVQ